MLGAIIGDIAGSRFEWHNIKTKEFDLLTTIGRCRPTDDSVMSLAVAKAILNCNGDYTCLDVRRCRVCRSLGVSILTPDTEDIFASGSMTMTRSLITASAMERLCA